MVRLQFFEPVPGRCLWLRVISLLSEKMSSQVVGQVSGSDTVEHAHPIFKPRMAGIDVLDVTNTAFAIHLTARLKIW